LCRGGTDPIRAGNVGPDQDPSFSELWRGELKAPGERRASQAGRVVEADVSPGSRFKGCEDLIVQDLSHARTSGASAASAG
jgi:hypothetical protein